MKMVEREREREREADWVDMKSKTKVSYKTIKIIDSFEQSSNIRKNTYPTVFI
jgi:hypothetical protein